MNPRTLPTLATVLFVAIVVMVDVNVVVVGDNLDLYSSTFEMSRLFTAELKFVEALRNFSQSGEKYSDMAKIFYDDVYKNYNPGRKMFSNWTEM